LHQFWSWRFSSHETTARLIGIDGGTEGLYPHEPRSLSAPPECSTVTPCPVTVAVVREFTTRLRRDHNIAAAIYGGGIDRFSE
jgi:hypothetical protein